MGSKQLLFAKDNVLVADSAEKWNIMTIHTCEGVQDEETGGKSGEEWSGEE